MRARAVPLAALFAAACATLPPSAPPAAGSFHLGGRVSIRYGGDAASGRVTWHHSSATDDLVISSPLGQGIAEITRRDGVYTLTTADRRRYTAADPEALTEQVLGWRLPLDGLPDWVQGRAVAGVPAESRADGAGRLIELRQSGWQIEYLAYDETLQRPSRMRLARDALDIRLLIEDWDTPR